MRLVFDTQNLNYWHNYIPDGTTIEEVKAMVVTRLDNLKALLEPQQTEEPTDEPIEEPTDEEQIQNLAEERNQLKIKIADLLLSLFGLLDIRSITEVETKKTMEKILKTKALEDEIDERQLQLTEEQTSEIVDMFLKMKA